MSNKTDKQNEMLLPGEKNSWDAWINYMEYLLFITASGTVPGRAVGSSFNLQFVWIFKGNTYSCDIYRKAALDICSKQAGIVSRSGETAVI